MPPGMAIMIVDDDVVVYKSGRVSLMSMEELREIANEAFERVMREGIDHARQPI